MPEPTDGTYEALRDGLLQDLIAVRVLIGQARPALPAEAEALHDALDHATETLDDDIASIRAILDRLRDREAA